MTVRGTLDRRLLAALRRVCARLPAVEEVVDGYGWVSLANPLDGDWDEVQGLIVDGYRMAAPKGLGRRVAAS